MRRYTTLTTSLIGIGLTLAASAWVFVVVAMTIGLGEPAERQPMPPLAGSRSAANSVAADLAANPLAWIPPSAR